MLSEDDLELIARIQCDAFAEGGEQAVDCRGVVVDDPFGEECQVVLGELDELGAVQVGLLGALVLCCSCILLVTFCLVNPLDKYNNRVYFNRR